MEREARRAGKLDQKVSVVTQGLWKRQDALQREIAGLADELTEVSKQLALFQVGLGAFAVLIVVCLLTFRLLQASKHCLLHCSCVL